MTATPDVFRACVCVCTGFTARIGMSVMYWYLD